VQSILDAVEIDDVPRDVRLHLQAVLRRHDCLRALDPKRFPAKGEGDVTLLLRTIVESTNGTAALTLPIIMAVCVNMKSAWTDLGLRWLEAFDQIDLVGLHATLVGLGLEDQLARVLRGKLEGILGPPMAPKQKQKSKAKAWAKPPNISEETWTEISRMYKKPAQGPVARAAAS
jgi:hypothetical protein